MLWERVFSPAPVFVHKIQSGGKRFSFNTKEEHVTLYHENGTSSVFVGAVNKLYYFNFETSDHYEEPFDATQSKCKDSTYSQNYLTLVVKYKGKLLVCGSNACSPTCWNWVDGKKEPGISALGLAPHYPELNSFVLFYGDNIYSAISKSGAKLVRFRRVKGPWDLYSSDSLWHNPELVQGAIIKNEEAYKDKIYLFFQEDNPEWPKNPEALKRISRVAQLCAVKTWGKVGRGGGLGSRQQRNRLG
ncbi:UNVERIFIED_CONTAM: hypothetical protein K2H54_002091 [Gekko kuhli]